MGPLPILACTAASWCAIASRVFLCVCVCWYVCVSPLLSLHASTRMSLTNSSCYEALCTRVMAQHSANGPSTAMKLLLLPLVGGTSSMPSVARRCSHSGVVGNVPSIKSLQRRRAWLQAAALALAGGRCHKFVGHGRMGWAGTQPSARCCNMHQRALRVSRGLVL